MTILALMSSNTTDSITDEWDSGTFTTRVSDGEGGYCFYYGYGTGTATKTVTASGTLIVNFGWKCVDRQWITVQFYNDATLNGTFYITFFDLGEPCSKAGVKNAAGTVIEEYDVGYDFLNRWNHLEVKMQFSDTGACVVKLDEDEIINIASADFKGGTNATSNKVVVSMGGGAGATKWLRKFLIMDTTGSYANDFIGAFGVTVITPDGDDSVAFSRSAGSDNYANVDELPYDSDTTYNLSNVAALDKFTMSGDLTGKSILGIKTHLVARKETVGTDPNLHLHTIYIDSGTNEVKLSEFTPTTSYTDNQNFVLVDPITNLPFTPTAMNAFKAGYRLE